MRISVEPSTDPADYPFRHRIRVRFAETDAMQIVHHGRYLPYLEEGRVAYLRHIGHPYTEWRERGTDSAVLEAYVRYIKPLRFDARHSLQGGSLGIGRRLDPVVEAGDEHILVRSLKSRECPDQTPSGIWRGCRDG